MRLSIITLLLAATTIHAHPFASTALVGEDKPWQIYNLSVLALPTNTTRLNAAQYISFAAVDVNEGLTFNTSCNKYAQAGVSLFQTTYTRCEFSSAAFSLRKDGKLWFQRRFQNKYDALPDEFAGQFDAD
jgi:hypothetical protein